MFRSLLIAPARNPLAVIGIAAVGGVLAADAASLSLIVWFFVAACLLALAVWKGNAWALLLAVPAVFGFIHVVSLASTRDHPINTIGRSGDRFAASIVGHFLRAPMVRDDEPARRQALFRVSAIDLPTRGIRMVGTADVRVWINDPGFDPQGGDYRLTGTLTLTARAWNPTLFDPVTIALRQGRLGDFDLRTVVHQQQAFSLRLALLRWAEQSRTWIAGQVTRGIQDDPVPATIITTMALGTSDSRANEIAEAFRKTGTLHIFAVSGLHISLLALISMILLRPLGVRRTKTAALVIPLLFGYAFITGWAPSAARAAWMSALILLGPLLNRRARVVNSLGAAVLVLLAGDTQQLFQAGFQLSFVVLGAIAIGAAPLAARFRSWTDLDPFLPPSVANWRQRSGAASRRWLVGTLCTSTVAWLGSLPLMIGHFHSCTPVAVIANGVLVPLSTLSLFVVVLSMLCGAVHLHVFQDLLNNCNWLFAKLMMLSSAWFASIPGGNFTLSPEMLRFEPHPDFQLHVLSMPPGEAAQVLNSGSSNWLLDCGNARSYRRTLLPVLRYQAVPGIDALVLSHADAGHIGGATSVLDENPFAQVFAGPHEPWRLDSHATAMWQTGEWLQARSRRLLQLAEDDVLLAGNARLHVLYPRPGDGHDKADDRSLVVRIDHGPFRILWCNDAGFITEKALLDRCAPRDLRVDVLVRNQHAADWSALSEFLAAARPRAIISSNAPAMADERLPPSLRAYCAAHEIALFDQNETGAVRIYERAGILSIEGWLNEQSIRLQPDSPLQRQP